jgi:hypothetical protein
MPNTLQPAEDTPVRYAAGGHTRPIDTTKPAFETLPAKGKSVNAAGQVVIDPDVWREIEKFLLKQPYQDVLPIFDAIGGG